MLVVLGLVLLAFAAGWIIGRETAPDGGGAPASATTAGEGGNAGREVFSAQCASCHTFAAAGATGTVGPDLDETQLGEDEIAAIVREGRGGMPAFAGRLGDEEIEAVARFVAGSR